MTVQACKGNLAHAVAWWGTTKHLWIAQWSPSTLEVDCLATQPIATRSVAKLAVTKDEPGKRERSPVSPKAADGGEAQSARRWCIRSW